MDTNTLQILVTLLGKQKPDGRSEIEITLLVLAAFAPVILAFAAWIKSKTIEAKLDVVHDKVNGALESMKAQAREVGALNGRAIERSEQQRVKETVAAVKEVIDTRKPVESPPASPVTQQQIVDALKKLPP